MSWYWLYGEPPSREQTDTTENITTGSNKVVRLFRMFVIQLLPTLANLKGDRDAHPHLGVQILSISRSFQEHLAKLCVCSCHPASGKSWIRHWSIYFISWQRIQFVQRVVTFPVMASACAVATWRTRKDGASEVRNRNHFRSSNKNVHVRY